MTSTHACLQQSSQHAPSSCTELTDEWRWQLACAYAPQLAAHHDLTYVVLQLGGLAIKRYLFSFIGPQYGQHRPQRAAAIPAGEGWAGLRSGMNMCHFSFKDVGLD